MPEAKPQDVSAVYQGARKFRGDRDNMPSVTHHFTEAMQHGQPAADLHLNDIKLLQKARLVKGQRYEISFAGEPFFEPIRIGCDGEVYYKKTNNTIMHRNKDGVEENLSFDSTMQKMGADIRAYNRKLIAEGKPPIEVPRKRW